jgi:hypothetical protein
MDLTGVLDTLDKEIARLRLVRSILVGEEPIKERKKRGDAAVDATTTGRKQGRGRPKGLKNKAVSFDPEEFAPKRRRMSPEGRERIAAAQRARWALKKKKAGPVKKAADKAASRTTDPLPTKRMVKGNSGKAQAKKSTIKTAMTSKPAATKKAASRSVTGAPKTAVGKPAAKAARKPGPGTKIRQLSVRAMNTPVSEVLVITSPEAESATVKA